MEKQVSETNIKEMKERGIRFYQSVEEQEMDRLRRSVLSTDEEKFKCLMKLMKMQQDFKKGIIDTKSSQE